MTQRAGEHGPPLAKHAMTSRPAREAEPAAVPICRMSTDHLPGRRLHVLVQLGAPSAAAVSCSRDAGVIWTDDNLFHYLGAPKQFLEKKTGKSFASALYMSFFIGEEAGRRDVIAYLRAIKGRPECD
jgi:hypothetical protein